MAKTPQKQLKGKKNLKKWHTIFDGPKFGNGLLKKLQFSIKQIKAAHLKGTIKQKITISFPFNENKQWKRVSEQIF